MSVPLGRTLLLVVGVGLLGVGIWRVQWTDPPADEASPTIRWAAPRTGATGAGERGPWRMNDSEWAFVDDPTVALADDGTMGVVWTNHERQDLFFQAYGPDGAPRRASPVNVSRSPEVFSWLPRMVMPTGQRDTIYVLWQEIVFSGGTHGGDILFARSTDGGHSFDPPLNLSQSEAGDGKGRLTREQWDNGSLDLAVGPAGTVYAAWTTYEGRLWFSYSTTDGSSFSAPRSVAGAPGRPARALALAADADGRLHLAWTVGERPRADIRYARADSVPGEFEHRHLVAPSAGYADAPKLAVDAAGTVHLAYSEYPAPDERAPRIQYTQVGADSGASSRTLSRPDGAPYDRAAFPYLRTGPDNQVVVLWELFQNGQRRPQAFGYTTSRDGGTTFAAPRILPGSEAPNQGLHGSQQGLLMEKLAVNRAGDVAVVNSLFRLNDTSRIRRYRGTLEPQ